MDGLSIAVSALQLAGALRDVCKFIRAVSQLGQNIKALRVQAEELASLLENLHKTLQLLPRLKDDLDQASSLLSSVERFLQSCAETIKELSEKIGSVNTKWRQVKFVWNQQDVDTLLARLKTHCINMQLAMATLNLQVALSLPSTIIMDHAIRFEKLERMISTLDYKMANRHDRYIADQQLSAITLDGDTICLKEVADSIITRANTIAACSVLPGDATSTTQQDEPAFSYIKMEDTTDAKYAEFGTTGSERGVPLNQGRRSQIEEWIPVQMVQKVVETDEESTGSPDGKRSYGALSGTSAISETAITDDLSEIFDDSSDDELDLHAAENMLSKGDAAYAMQNYTAAENFFRRGLRTASHAASERIGQLRLREIKFKLAMSCLHAAKNPDVEKLFLEIANDEVHDIKGAMRKADSLHNLAGIHLQKGSYDAAFTCCRQSLEVRRRIRAIGRKHPQYFASLRLLAIILYAKGDATEAEAYAEILPEEYRPTEQELSHGSQTGFQPSAFSLQNDAIEHSPARSATSATSPRLPAVSFATSVPLRRRISDTAVPYTTDAGLDTTDGDGTTSSSMRPRAQSTVVKPTDRPFHARASKSLDVFVDEFLDVRGDGTSQKDVQVDTDAGPVIYHNRTAYGVNQYTPTVIVRPPSVIETCQDSAALVSNSAIDASTADIPLVDASTADDFWASHQLTELSIPEETLQSSSEELEEAQAELKSKDPLFSNVGILKSARANLKMMNAAAEGRIDVVNLLLKNSTSKSNIASVTIGGRTPLIKAVENGHLEIAAILINASADVNQADRNGLTPLMISTVLNHHRLTQLLISKGASPTAGKPIKSLPLTRAAGQDNAGVCLLLLEAGAPVDGVDGEPDTPLMRAAKEGRPLICQLLISHGANSNLKKDNSNTTALHYAAERDYTSVCQALINNGADIEARTSIGATPLMFATQYGNASTIQMLLDNNANIEAEDDRGDTVLNWAAQFGTIENCRCLLRNGANTNRRNKKGRSAADVAKTPEMKELIHGGAS